MLKRMLILTFLGFLLAACGGGRAEELLESGNAAFAQEDYATALAAYDQAAAAAPELAEPLYNAANVHYRAGDYAQAEETLAVAMIDADAPLQAQAQYNFRQRPFSKRALCGSRRGIQSRLAPESG